MFVITEGEILSRKADVYSFGVILLELITGKKAYNSDSDRSEDVIAMWFEKKKDDFWKSIENDIEKDYETQQSVQEVAELAGSCCEMEAEMSQIVRVLSAMIEIRDKRNQASSSGS
ncbi:unnamed protein product [Brassica rapa subsp. narinosa]|uniref:Uncharacterized protein n=1 Tax=Brassica campestris TaxID=3711 RepID=M4CHJ3_BRACM